jgi:hypothetical protein
MVEQEQNNQDAFSQAKNVGQTLGYSIITSGENYRQLALSTNIYQNHYKVSDV